MGYRRKPKQYRLTFEDPEYDGFEAYAVGLPLGRMLDLLDTADLKGKESSELTEHERAELTSLLETFSKCLVSWNLEDEDGTPVGTDMDGLRELDLAFVLELVFAWMDAVVNVSGPLRRRSSGGDQSPAALIPMDVQ